MTVVRDMLTVRPLSQLPADIMDELQATDIDFHLTGSRFMACARPDSDWDFLVQDCPEARAFLLGCGYYELGVSKKSEDGKEGYNPVNRPHCNTAHIYVGYRCNVQVHVITTVDLALQLRCRNHIAFHLLSPHIKADNKVRALLWDALAAVFKSA